MVSIPGWEVAKAALDRLDPVALAAELVRIPSHPGLPRQEEAVAFALAEFLHEHGLEATLDRAAPGRPNVLCTVAGKRSGRRLLLCGHTDTVPLNRDAPGVGFSGAVVDGRLHGRGAVDMKGAVAAMATAIVALAESGVLDGGEAMLAAVVDEEMESLGAERLVASGLTADGAVVGEPTGNRICLGHKGLEWLEIDFRGKAAHGGDPAAGVNAIVAAGRFLTLVERELQPELAARRHPLLGPPTLNFGTVQGGDQPSTVAATCRLTADRRLLPDESYASVVEELEALLARVRAQTPGLSTAVSRMPGGMATLDHVALVTVESHPLVTACGAACQALGVTGSDGFAAFPAWTDGALLSRFAAVPTVIVGPGDLALAHAPEESVPAAEIVEAARLYTAIALLFCREPG
jgi:acetylornithine deacetylase/succinyl-diaminopimelate desuccinylase